MKTLLSSLWGKFRGDSPDHPPCALCGKIIQGVDEHGEEVIAIRFFSRPKPEAEFDREIAVCPDCFLKIDFDR